MSLFLCPSCHLLLQAETDRQTDRWGETPGTGVSSGPERNQELRPFFIPSLRTGSQGWLLTVYMLCERPSWTHCPVSESRF